MVFQYDHNRPIDIHKRTCLSLYDPRSSVLLEHPCLGNHDYSPSTDTLLALRNLPWMKLSYGWKRSMGRDGGVGAVADDGCLVVIVDLEALKCLVRTLVVAFLPSILNETSPQRVSS